MMVFLECSLSFARLKASRNESVHSMCSFDWRPPVTLSNGASNAEYPGITRASIL